ncbi:MAG: hypothetical protein JW882_22105 [Deltaproteobacteria bacterium]|nr:hypothetical protein [Deltaproteobacteria bacterium]
MNRQDAKITKISPSPPACAESSAGRRTSAIRGKGVIGQPLEGNLHGSGRLYQRGMSVYGFVTL